MSETILVTGATGTVGREVVRQLAHSSARVRAGARHFSYDVAGVRNVPYVVFDFDRPHTLDPALADVDRVFFLTPLDERMEERSSVFLEKARASGVRHIVRLSAMGADFEPPIRLGEAHRAVERHIEASGLAYTTLRPNSFMQNYLTYFGETIRRYNAFYLPQGEGRVSLIDVRDIAAVAVCALLGTEHEGKTYELTGAEALSNDDVATVLSNTCGRRIHYVDVAEEEARKALEDQGMSRWLMELIIELYRISRHGRAARISPAVQAVLHRAPISFTAFAADHVEYFQ